MSPLLLKYKMQLLDLIKQEAQILKIKSELLRDHELEKVLKAKNSLISKLITMNRG